MSMLRIFLISMPSRSVFLPTPHGGFGISERVCVPPFQWIVKGLFVCVDL